MVQALQDWYFMSQRKYATFQKLYDNDTLTYDQVAELKKARAAFETIPKVVFAPYLIFLMRACLRANDSKRISNAIVYGLTGFLGCEVLTRYARDKVYWPVVATVYAEALEREQAK